MICRELSWIQNFKTLHVQPRKNRSMFPRSKFDSLNVHQIFMVNFSGVQIMKIGRNQEEIQIYC